MRFRFGKTVNTCIVKLPSWIMCLHPYHIILPPKYSPSFLFVSPTPCPHHPSFSVFSLPPLCSPFSLSFLYFFSSVSLHSPLLAWPFILKSRKKEVFAYKQKYKLLSVKLPLPKHVNSLITLPARRDKNNFHVAGSLFIIIICEIELCQYKVLPYLIVFCHTSLSSPFPPSPRMPPILPDLHRPLSGWLRLLSPTGLSTEWLLQDQLPRGAFSQHCQWRVPK